MSGPRFASVPGCRVFPLHSGFGRYFGGDAAARRKACGHFHASRAAGVGEVVEDVVGEPLVEDALVTVTLHVEFETLEFNAEFVGAVFDDDLAEVRLAGLRAQAGKFRAPDGDGVVPPRAGVIKKLELVFIRHVFTFVQKVFILLLS